MTVQITPTVEWINPCFPHEDRHEHVSAYLVRAEDGDVLIDSGSFYHREEIWTEIERATDGEGLDAIVLSHSDYPHAGNVPAFRSEWDDVELVASSGSPEIQGLADARRSRIGGELTVCGRRLSFIDPPLADRSHTTWIYDHEDRLLFTADGFGHYHDEGNCDATASELPGGIDREDVYAFHRDNLVWLRYVDAEKLRAAVESIFEEYPIECVAPVHGNPIDGDRVDDYVEKLVDAAARISAEYEVPSAD